MMMQSKMKSHVAVSIMLLAAMLVATSLAGAQAASRFLGTITAINGSTLTVKTDAGAARVVDVPSTASLKRIAPGVKDLSSAAAIQFQELATGDRVLVKLDPNAPAGTTQALQVVTVKQEDVALKQEKEREDWQRRGLGGLVKSVDSATGAIVLTSGAGATAKTITVHTTSATILKRYAPASVRYDLAQTAPIDAIHAGDQLRARGAKNADGTEITAEEVVSGGFRNISGTITSLDTAKSTLVVKDLATKKPVTVAITADAQMRQLPDRMATMLMAALKGNAGGVGARNGSAPMPQGGTDHAQGQFGGGQQGAPGHGSNGLDPQQMLSHAPAIQFADLKKGEAVMLVTTEGASDVTVITLLAGVEPLLEAPAASNLLSNWSMNSGSGATEEVQ
jgi:hypothetical protein